MQVIVGGRRRAKLLELQVTTPAVPAAPLQGVSTTDEYALCASQSQTELEIGDWRRTISKPDILVSGGKVALSCITSMSAYAMSAREVPLKRGMIFRPFLLSRPAFLILDSISCAHQLSTKHIRYHSLLLSRPPVPYLYIQPVYLDLQTGCMLRLMLLRLKKAHKAFERRGVLGTRFLPWAHLHHFPAEEGSEAKGLLGITHQAPVLYQGNPEFG